MYIIWKDEQNEKRLLIEMFNEIKKLEVADGSETTVEDILLFFCESVEKALQRLEAIENANPSGALKCLIGLEKEIIQRDGRITDFLKIKFDTIKQALIKAQEQEKEYKELKENVKRWHDLLLKSGIDSKGMVAFEIEEYWSIKAGV